MGATWYRARALLRRHRGTTALLVLLVALAGGVVIATVAGARRTGDALPEFLEYHNGQDVSAFIYFGTIPPDEEAALVESIVALPQWEAVGTGQPIVLSIRDGDRWVTQVAIGIADGPYLRAWDRPILVDGELPDPAKAEEVAVNEAFAESLGLEAGDTFPLRTVTPSALDDASAGRIQNDPEGEDLTMTVAGIVRRPVDLGIEREVNTAVFGPETWFVEVGAAFVDRFEGRMANYGTAVQGRAKPGRTSELAEAIVEVGGPQVEVEAGSEVEEVLGSIQRGIDFERSALLLFALVALATAAALIGQVLGRQVAVDLDDDAIMRAEGMQRTQRAAVPMARAALIAVLGGAGAAVVATLASDLFPIGVARRAALDPGLRIDGAVVGVGVTLVVLAVLGRAGIGAWRATRASVGAGDVDRPTRVSTISAALAGAGAPITTVAGVRMATERGRGRTAIPVAGAILATTTGVFTLTALLVFATNLDRMVATPALQGWTWDVYVANLNDDAAVDEAVAALRDNPRVESYIGFGSGPVVVDGVSSYGSATGRGDPEAGPQVTEGRLATAPGEVVLGRQTLADLDKEIGDRVELSAAPGAPTVSARIVGTAMLPAGLDTQLTFGRGALLTGDGLAAVFGDGQTFTPNSFLVNFTDETTVDVGVDSLRDDFPETIGRFDFADDVANLQRVQRVPRILAALVALLALGTLANTLVTSVRRHRRDLATFAAFGLRRRQLAATVAWQATTFAVIALVLGIPLGIAAGRTAWRLMMDSIGAVVTPSVPFALLMLVAMGTLVAANVIAALPARSAARTHPAEILHSE